MYSSLFGTINGRIIQQRIQLFLLLKIFNNHLMVKEDETQNCFLMELAVGDYFKSMSSGEFQINFQVTDYGL